jgi:membrane fusion protein, heavy metal efflux system
MYRLLLIFAMSFILASCSSTPENTVDDQGHDHADSGTAVTEWTDQMELFMEHPPLISGQEVQFIVHLTKVENFKPVLHGKLTLSFEPHAGKGIVIESDAPARDGIFLPTAIMPQADEYDFMLSYKGEGISETFDLGHVLVYANEAEFDASLHVEDAHDHAHDDPADHSQDYGQTNQMPDELVTFLKEQQWKTSFQTAFGIRMDVKASISAVAHIIPNQQGYAQVVAPVEGFINVQYNQNLAAPGSKVKAGDVLAIVSPHVGRANTWTERQLSFQHAQKNYQRAAGLLKRNAISEKEYEELEQVYLVEKAGYETLLSVYGADVENDKASPGQFQLKSPIDGIVSEVSVLPGQAITAGQKIMTVVDPSTVWLQADIFEKDYYQMGGTLGASLTVPGMTSSMHLQKDEFVLINKSDLVDEDSRTISVLYEIKNKDRLLKIGQVVQAEIYTSEQQHALCVPTSALLDEDERDIIFIQREGEAFEKRIVELGPTFYGWVSIKDGLQDGERVVTQGAYQLKLASVSTGIGQAHVH